MKYEIKEPTSLLDALKKMYPDSSKRTLQNWLKNGRFCVDEKMVQKGNILLEKGQIISAKITFKPPKIPGIPVLYEDRHLIVIDKPVGLLSVPLDDDGEGIKDALTILKEHYQSDQIHAVHRIDRGTSGILLFARGKESEKRFDTLFEAHDIERNYYAIVEGNLKTKKGTWECKLLELPSYHVVESEEGKTAITHFEVIRTSAKYTYLKLTLETGKKHQIRVQCQKASHPIVGDKRYGAIENPLKRLCLHACSLGFTHPFTKKQMRFTSPLPRSFQALGGFLKK